MAGKQIKAVKVYQYIHWREMDCVHPRVMTRMLSFSFHAIHSIAAVLISIAWLFFDSFREREFPAVFWWHHPKNYHNIMMTDYTVITQSR